MAVDQPAAFTPSYAAYVALDSMIMGRSCGMAVLYGFKPAARSAFDCRMSTT